MNYMDINYNIVGVIKSQICSTIANSENVRKAIDFKGTNCKDYDPDDPLTLVHNCIIPWLQNPETITTTNENGVGNVILAGHWIATSPLWYEKLDKLCGASSLQEVYDTGRKCCFLVDSMWLTETF